MEVPLAANPTEPIALIERSVLTCTESVISASESAAPIAAFSPAALAEAFVVSVTDCSAATSTLPPTVNVFGLLPIVALVVSATMASDRTGTMLMPPSAPASASVSIS
ncbi:hypothetical protein GALL_548160 [mine drainage metagenome]|uniref:Uncharacterized protein n=1 Tax=mine drainage metagenome TaxID=410659 RepID=A0A1J5PEI1_9ZZZZ